MSANYRGRVRLTGNERPPQPSALAATHRPIRDFNWHVWEEHVYEGGDLPVDLTELVYFHGALHDTGLGHKPEVDELQMRSEPARVAVH